jgi:alginate biosynthesis protein AlgX
METAAMRAVPQGRGKNVLAVLAITVSLFAAGEARASEYDCHNLVRVAGQPVIEGIDGFFFRTTPDLTEYFPLGDRTLVLMKTLASALEARGTSLVYVPVPTKGSVSGPFLPRTSLEGIFDQSLARHSYDTFVARMQSAGIDAVNIATALDAKSGGEPTFLGADHHWTSDGARLAARAVAQAIAALPGYADLKKSQFVSASNGRANIASSMRRSIQAACRSPLPPNDTLAFETKLAPQATGDQTVDLFGGSSDEGRIALAGTSFSDIEQFNFGGFISEFTGLDVTNFAISGGNQFVSIQSYLTSEMFAQQPPRILVWENPIYDNLGDFGDGPMLELIAAASGACDADRARALEPQLRDGNSIVVALGREFSGNSVSFIAIDAHDERVRGVNVDFLDGDGTHSIRKIVRSPRFKGNGRFFVPLPDAGEAVTSATITTSDAPLDKASVNFCRYPVTEG